jgi:hypothetical protein
MAAYTVDVELTLTGTIMSALAAVAGAQGLGAVSAAVAGVEAGFARWSSVLVGGAGVAIGASVMGALMAIANQADKTQDAIARLKLQNLPTVEFEKNVEAASQTSAKLGVKPDIAQDAMTKIQSMVSNPEAARRVLEPVLRMGKILESFDKGGVEQVYPIVRMLEETNLITDPGRAKALNVILERLGKTLVQSGGTINPTQIQLSNVYARTARYGYTSDEALLKTPHPFFTDILPYYAQMSGRAGQGGGGAALMSMYSKVHGMGLSKSSKAMARVLGLLEDSGQLSEAEKFDVNPYEWVQTTLVPAIKDKIGLTDSKKQQTAIASVIQHLFGTRLAADPATEFALAGRAYRGEESPFEQHMKRLDKSSGLEGVEKLQQTSPTAAAERLSAEWSRLWANIGSALTQDKINILLGLSDGIQKLADAVKQTDPEVIRNVAKAITAIAAAFAGVGLAALTGWPGMITGLGIAAREASPEFEKFTNLMGKNLLTAIQGIAHAATDAANALSGFLDKLQALAVKLGLASPASTTPFSDYYHRKHPSAVAPPGGWNQPLPGGSLPGLHPGDLLKRSSFSPTSGGSDKNATINNVIYLDGAQIARAVHDYLISGVEHPVQAPYFDGRDGHTSPDHQPITT